MSNLKIETHQRAYDENIFDLQQCVYPDHFLYKDRQLTRDYWQWRYFSHPEIKSRVFVMREEKNGLVAGMRPVTFLPIRLDGREVLSAWLTAVITHPRYRRMGIFTGLVKHSMAFARQAGAEFAFTFPNEQSYAVYKKKPEWNYIAAMPLYLKILRPLSCTRIGMGKVPLLRQWVKSNPAVQLNRSESSFEQSPLNPLFYKGGQGRGWDGSAAPQRQQDRTPPIEVKNRNVCKTVDNRQFEVRLAERIGAEYDRLWERISGDYKIVVKRDAAYLNWRYRENPISEYTVFEARKTYGDGLLGYLVVTLQMRGAMAMGLIVDMLVENEENAVTRALIKAAGTFFKSSGAAVAAALMNRKRPYADSLVRCGYIPVPNRIAPKKFHMICSNLTDSTEFGYHIADFDNWYLTWGDTDNV